MYSIPFESERVATSAHLSDSCTLLRYVSAGRAEVLSRMHITTIRDVLLHIPFRYLDFSHITSIAAAHVGTQVSVVARVDKVETRRTKKMPVTQVSFLDDTGVLQAVFFRQPWLQEKLVPGTRVMLSGQVSFSHGFKQMKSPFLEVIDTDAEHIQGKIIPVYSTKDPLSPAWMRRILASALEDLPRPCEWQDPRIIASLQLMSFASALDAIHRPECLEDAEAARRRLAFDELMCVQLALRARRQLHTSQDTAHVHIWGGSRQQALLEALPFQLSDEQFQATEDISGDMCTPCVMNRLLLGDVGCGKTAVAAVALAACADSHTQGVLMAPTTVLAHQYAYKLGPWFDAAHIRWALIEAQMPKPLREEVLARLADGSIDVVFGTVALLNPDIVFNDLSLVVIDEQHRFGVRQRAQLREKGSAVDLLAMSATPIPRTLALSMYGDVDMSCIRHRPYVSKPVRTKVLSPDNLDLAWGAVRSALEQGQKVYIVCPAIETSDENAENTDSLDDVPELFTSTSERLRSVEGTYNLVSQIIFPSARVASVTGRDSAEYKDRVMRDFSAGMIDILVSTTVIEVGVDVPDATVMIIMDADRFGLATLHQLRGRIGRSDLDAQVFLCTATAPSSPARARLEQLEDLHDGFALAELDLQLRREGEVLGYRQHGQATLKLCDLAKDADLIEAAHRLAPQLLKIHEGLASKSLELYAREVRERLSIYFEELQQL